MIRLRIHPVRRIPVLRIQEEAHLRLPVLLPLHLPSQKKNQTANNATAPGRGVVTVADIASVKSVGELARKFVVSVAAAENIKTQM